MPMHDNENRAGFVDAHVHIEDVTALEEVRAAGIAAVRDAGLRRNAEQGLPLYSPPTHSPRVISSGWALYKKGGYGASFGVAVENWQDIASEILKLARAGADIIKVMASGIVSLKRPGTITPGGFSQEDLCFIVEEAKRQGLGVMAHANGEEAIMAAASAGVRSVEHGFLMTERALGAMAGHGIYWTPTVGALARAAESRATSEEAKAYIARLIVSHLHKIRQAHGMGVALAVGTDCILPDPRYREAYGAELLYFEQAGIFRDDVHTIAREGGARLLGLDY